ERRSAELDRDAVRLGAARKLLITDKMLKSTAEAITYDRESSATERLALSGRLKKRTSRALLNVGENITESKDYRDQLAGILVKRTHNYPVRECIPVMFYEQKSLTSADSTVTRVLSPDNLGQASRSNIETRMMQNMPLISSGRHNEYEKSMIRQAFSTLSEREIKDQRVRQIAQYLFDRGGLL
ncbi:MAG: hypothetical protein IKR59_08715, partial [Lachnospiraceae bacterium]|nr:hypothetical protein [Lachnospiraceae bacterium]